MDGDQIFQNVITEVLVPLYELVVGVSFIYFLYGAFMYIVELNNPEKKGFGRDHLLWGTIGLFIIMSVGGILKIFGSVFTGLFVY